MNYSEWTDEEVYSHDAYYRSVISKMHERHAQRRLFFSVMRHPELRLLRAALQCLKIEYGVDLTTITHLEIIPSTVWNSTWILLTDRLECVFLDPENNKPDFVYRLYMAENLAEEYDNSQEIRHFAATQI